jgi:hypothetical protein
MTTEESTTEIEYWLPRILRGMKQHQSMDIDPCLNYTLETLRGTRLEIKHLLVPTSIVQYCLELPLELARGNLRLD